MKKFMSFVFAALFAAATANAAVLVTEDFSYDDGDITTTSGGVWSAHSGAGAVPIQIEDEAAVFSHGSGSREDVSIDFGAVESDVLTATFDLVVNDDAAISGSDSEYFAHFFSTGSFNFTARVDIVPGEDDGDYTLGIATTSSTAESILGVDFEFGETVAVSLSYDFDTGLASLSAGGETESSTTSVIEDELNLFGLRQSNSSSDETITVDNLVVTGTPVQVPEPTSVALILFGASAFGAVSMRRRLG